MVPRCGASDEREQSDSGGSEDKVDSVSGLLSACLSPGLDAALADVDRIFRRGEPDLQLSTDAVRKWVKERVVAEYSGEASPDKYGSREEQSGIRRSGG